MLSTRQHKLCSHTVQHSSSSGFIIAHLLPPQEFVIFYGAKVNEPRPVEFHVAQDKHKVIATSLLEVYYYYVCSRWEPLFVFVRSLATVVFAGDALR